MRSPELGSIRLLIPFDSREFAGSRRSVSLLSPLVRPSVAANWKCLFNVGSVCFPPCANRMFGFPALGLPRAEGVGSDTQEARGAGVGGSHGAGFRACSLEVCFQMTWAIWCKTRGSKPCDEAGKLTVSHQACRLKFAWCTEIVAYGAAVRA